MTTFQHLPVLFDEVMEWMRPKAGGVYLDGTLGGGGHSEGILAACGRATTLFGIDRDPEAVRAAGERLGHYEGFHALHGNFHDVKGLLEKVETVARGSKWARSLQYDECICQPTQYVGADFISARLLKQPFDGILLDLGVSSHQLDTPERGFSYHEDAPLDMRMDQASGQTAAGYLAAVSKEEFRRILAEYGEEKWAARIAEIFAERRANSPILTTGDLVAVVDAAIPKAVRRKDDGHPARRTFQAVRIALNDELAPLEKALCDLVDCLAPTGRLLVITFHSLEDRIVKNTFRRLQNPCVCPPKAPICICGKKPVGRVLAKGAVKPGAEEVERNARARSAKLRVFERG